VKAWNTADGSLLWEVHLQGYWIENIQFSPDGKPSWWETVPSRAACRGTAVQSMFSHGRRRGDNGHPGQRVILDLAFSPDGSTLAMGTTEALRLFDAIQMDEIGRISHRGKPGTSVIPRMENCWLPVDGPRKQASSPPGKRAGVDGGSLQPPDAHLTPAEWRQYLGSEPYAANLP
jgi:WD40 repeat protein